MGVYKLRLCKNGEWVVITIDDYIPCFYNAGPMFSRSNGDELWVLLLEKAYAKLHGNYYSLRFGLTQDGLIDMTGCPTSSPFDWDPAHLNPADKDTIWTTILEADQQGFSITCETPGEDKVTERGGGGGKGTGIVSGHAYSLLRAVEHNGVRLLNIRNPWGKFEWDGDWSDGSELWTEEFIDAIKPVFDTSDGGFWISFEDFIFQYNSFNIVEVKPWEEMRLKGKFI